MRYGIGKEEHSHEGRAITLEFEQFFLVNVYTPNSQNELARLPYRMQWEDDLRAYLCALDTEKPVVYCGDLNVAHREIDLKNPKQNIHSAGFSYEERQKMTDLLMSGFVAVSYTHLDVYKRQDGLDVDISGVTLQKVFVYLTGGHKEGE